MEQTALEAKDFLANDAYWKAGKEDKMEVVVVAAPASPKKKKVAAKKAPPKAAEAPAKEEMKKSPRASIKKAEEKKKPAEKAVAKSKKAAKESVKKARTSGKSARSTLFTGALDGLIASSSAAASSSSSSSSADDNASKKAELLKSFQAAGPVKGVDVVFSFDTTGSMSGYLMEVKKNLEDMIKQLLTDLPTIRVGIMCHGDYCDKHSAYVTTHKDLSRDADDIVKFVTGVRSTGGGDLPEAYELALRECSKDMSWNEEHSKALVVIGDAYPHPPSFTPEHIDWEEEVADLAKKGVKIYSVQCGGDATSTKFFKTMAEATAGSYMTLKELPLIKDMFMGVCYREGYEMELASNAKLYEGVVDDLNKEIESLGVEGGAGRLLRPDESREAISLSNEDMLKVHEAIHGGDDKVELLGASYPISWGTYGNRFVRINEHGLLFIQQNIERNTSFAQMAREGKKITWMCKEGKWGVVVNGSIDKKLD